jgi:hypothetical protein
MTEQLDCRSHQVPNPETHKAAAAVERRWATLTSEEELKVLRASLQHLLTRLTEVQPGARPQ